MQGDRGAVEGLPSGADRQAAVGQLLSAPANLAQLYNDYASRFHLWPQAIQTVDLARHDDGRFICQLWDVALRQVRSCNPSGVWGSGSETPPCKGCVHDLV